MINRQSQATAAGSDKITALYCRLSRDDELQDDSNSSRTKRPFSISMPMTTVSKPMGQMPALSGMVYCADCGRKLYQVRCTTMRQNKYMVCSGYRKIKGACTSHQIFNKVIENLLPEKLQNLLSLIGCHEDIFVRLAIKCRATQFNGCGEGQSDGIESFLKIVRGRTEITELSPLVDDSFFYG